MKGIPIILLLFLFLGSYAQDVHEHKDGCNVCEDKTHLAEKPYIIKFKKELPYMAVGTVLTGFATYAEFNNTVQPFTEAELLTLDANDVNAFDRGAISNWSPTAHMGSNILISTATFLPVIFVANHHTRSDLIPLTVMSVEVLLTNFGATILMKNLVNRARPLTYNPKVSLEERTNATSKESFFSGHASHTTAASVYFAKVVTDYHPNMKKGMKIGLWSTMLALPAATAYLRVKAGKHFPSDVIVGYVVGGSIGYLIPHLHKIQANKTNPRLSWFPIVGPGYATVNLHYKL